MPSTAWTRRIVWHTTHRFAEALEIVETIDKRRLEKYSGEEIDVGYEGYFSPISESSSEQLVLRDIEMFELSLRICSLMFGSGLSGSQST